MGGHKGGCCENTCDTGCNTGCGTAGYGGYGPGAPVITPPGTGVKPEVIPAPKDKKEMPKGGVTSIQIAPVTPVVAPRPPIELGGNSNPF